MPARTLALERCRHGQMLFFPEDEVIGRSLRIYGEWAEHELSCLRPFLPATGLVLDVGAHLGTHALAFARWAPGATVLALEPQPDVAAVLQVNAMLNGLGKIEVHAAGCADRDSWCPAPAAPLDNLGGFSLTDVERPAWWRRLWSPLPHGAIRLTQLDTLLEGRGSVGFVKMDIEGMELPALQGGMRMMKRDRPVLYLEQLSTTSLPALFDLLSPLDYTLHWLETQPFNKKNFRGVSENLWWRTETGLLVLPKGWTSSLPRASRFDPSPPARLDARVGWEGS